jgi:glycine/D-amino acid oxidase-like deaminating enzyme
VTAARRSYDVVVIGAGIVGVAAASELAGEGASVLLVERAVVAAGASGRNSGAVWHPMDPVLEALYVETLDRLRALPQALEAELPSDHPDRGFALPAEPVGILTLGDDAGLLAVHASALAASHPQLRPAFLDVATLARMEPSLAPGLSAVRLDIGFPVAPWAATHAFAELAGARGAELVQGSAAAIRVEDGVALGVTVDGVAIAAGAVIVAAGPWTPEVIDPSGTWRPIRPFWGVVVEIALAAPPHAIVEAAGIDDAIGPHAATAGAETVDFSLTTAAGRSALGSTFLPFEPDPHAYEARLRGGGAAYVPAIADAPTLSLRTCARPLAFDGRPLVGHVPGIDRLFVAAGHGPWGLSTGAASGAHIAGLVLGHADAVPAAIQGPVDPARFGAPPR